MIALRLLVGFHFFSEGLVKFQDQKPFSAGFFENAKGPLASTFRAHIWDPDGLIRLGYVPDPKGFPKVDTQPTLTYWESYRQRVAQHHRFDEQQSQRSQQLLKQYERLLREFVAGYEPEIREYFQGIERRDRYRTEPNRTEVASLNGQLTDIENKLKSQRQSLLKQVDAMWSGLERDLNSVAGEEGRKQRLPIGKLGRRMFDSVTFDRVIPWFDTLVGLSLITGLLVRLSATAGGLFLASVVATQWPGSPGAIPTWYQAIEMCALFHLAAVGAGRWGGLDALLSKCCAPKRGTGKKK